MFSRNLKAILPLAYKPTWKRETQIADEKNKTFCMLTQFKQTDPLSVKSRKTCMGQGILVIGIRI